MTKAFDKVWHNGLKYKLIRVRLADILQKVLCNFLDNRKAKINIGNEYSRDKDILSGVHQGSVLLPTLYTLYTNDLPPPEYGCLDTMYADDITQIIAFPSKSKLMMKIKVEREIKRICKFERSWKIKNSEKKFKIIPIAQLKSKEITVIGKEIVTYTSGKLLGLNITSTDFVSHTRKTIKKGNDILTQLRRFRNLSPKMKATLIKTLLIPVLEYPLISIFVASQTQKRNMQIVLNKAIRFIHCNEREELNTKDLHIKYNITPSNISIFHSSKQIWEIIKK